MAATSAVRRRIGAQFPRLSAPGRHSALAAACPRARARLPRPVRRRRSCEDHPDPMASTTLSMCAVAPPRASVPRHQGPLRSPLPALRVMRAQTLAVKAKPVGVAGGLPGCVNSRSHGDQRATYRQTIQSSMPAQMRWTPTFAAVLPPLCFVPRRCSARGQATCGPVRLRKRGVVGVYNSLETCLALAPHSRGSAPAACQCLVGGFQLGLSACVPGRQVLICSRVLVHSCSGAWRRLLPYAGRFQFGWARIADGVD